MTLPSSDHSFRIIFVQKNETYEIYARNVYQSSMFGFIEVEELLLGDHSTVLIDPSRDKLKNIFEQVRRTFIPVNTIIRIDEVTKEGCPKVHSSSNVTPFPSNS